MTQGACGIDSCLLSVEYPISSFRLCECRSTQLLRSIYESQTIQIPCQDQIRERFERLFASLESGLETPFMKLPRSPIDLLVALNCAPDATRETICKLGSSINEWIGKASALIESCRLLGLSKRRSVSIVDWLRHAGDIAAAEQRRASRLQARILTRGDEEYPPSLLDLELPPPVLYLRGSLPAKPAIAIVGSRRARATYLEVARMFGHGLAAAGITVISGFARGIDQAAHHGALSATGGTTVAILGCGLDVDYPGGARPLASRIVSSGAIVSEFPLRTRPFKSNFPIRNRLIAAMSLGTLVVQATLRSGSLITARLALDLGRDVYAVPGSIVDPSSAGTNGLIRDGALLAQETRDILEALPVLVRAELASTPEPDAPLDLDDPSDALLATMPKGRLISVEELAEKARLGPERILHELLDLEMQGKIRRCPGPMFLRSL